MDQASHAELEKKKAEMISKLFQCAETPIKEWLAEWLKVDVVSAFPDYVDDSDVIAFPYKNCHYTASLVPMPNGTATCFDEELLEKSEEAKKSASMLFDAVRMVLPAVTKTANELFRDKLEGIGPIFDESLKAFKLVRFNVSRYKKILCIKEYEQIINSIRELTQLEDKVMPEKLNEYKAHLAKLYESKKEKETIIDEITDEVMMKEQQLCDEMNEKLEFFSKLYMVSEVVDEEDEAERLQQAMHRLPMFGTTHHDPDEDTLIEKFKKENMRDW